MTEEIETVCELQQRSRAESPDDVSRTEWLLVLPLNTPAAGIDKVTIADVDYELIGDAWEVRHPVNGPHHVEATVRRAT